MSEYTKGKWSVTGSLVHFPEVKGGFDLRGCPDPEGNARRIVACVNACASIGTEALENNNVILSAKSYGEVVAQRNELLALLKRCHHDLNWEHDNTLLDEVSTAITKVQGGHQ